MCSKAEVERAGEELSGSSLSPGFSIRRLVEHVPLEQNLGQAIFFCRVPGTLSNSAGGGCRYLAAEEEYQIAIDPYGCYLLFAISQTDRQSAG